LGGQPDRRTHETAAVGHPDGTAANLTP